MALKLKDIVEKLGLTNFTPGVSLDREVKGGYTSDLLSDVMGHAREGQLWITLQTHNNVTGIASLKDLAGIVLVKGFKPAPDTVATAESEDIPILGTPMEAFEFSGTLFGLFER